MILAIALVIVLLAFWLTLGIRDRDLPEPEPVSPVKHLEDRKARIYESLRDLNFEYRIGKLSDEDYQSTKAGLQRELAETLAGIEQAMPAPPPPPPEAPPSAPPRRSVISKHVPPTIVVTCPHCAARFDKPMKFCGNCGRSMQVEA